MVKRKKGCSRCSYRYKEHPDVPFARPPFDRAYAICCIECGEHWWCKPLPDVQKQYIPDYSI